MSLSTTAFAEKFTGELDKILVDESAVGFMNDNAFRAKFVGAKTVKIPNISLQGLGDYDRDTGFINGTVSVANTAYTMKQDRARSFSIDREDMDETGIAELAGEVLSEFVRTKVIPETDAYTLSKLGALAASKGQIHRTYNSEKPYEAFNTLLDKVQEKVGMDEELVCFMSRYMWNKLRRSDEFSKVVDIGHFKQGELSFEINKIDNVSIIPVADSKMYTAFDFLSGEQSEIAGGFIPKSGSTKIYMIMLPKRAASLVKKSETVRIFTPDQNPNADAYKFDYRIYYDVFVKNSYLKSIWGLYAPELNIIEDLDTSVEVTGGNITETLSVTAEASNNFPIEYQWYECDGAYKQNSRAINGANGDTLKLNSDLSDGTYYYFVKMIAGTTSADSAVCKVNVV